jgi:hypothetical protein
MFVVLHGAIDLAGFGAQRDFDSPRPSSFTEPPAEPTIIIIIIAFGSRGCRPTRKFERVAVL